MNDDFEKRLSALLTEQVDHEAGPRRAAPPFDRRTAARRRAPWMTPLLAAACVAAVVAGGFGITSLVADRQSAPVGPTHPPSLVHNPTTSPTHVATTPTTKPTTSPTSRASMHLSGTPQVTGGSGSAPAGLTYAPFQGATIAVPAGWTTRKIAGAAGPSASQFWAGFLCLAPIGSATQDPCPIELDHLHPPTGKADSYPGLDVDASALGQGNEGQNICDGDVNSPQTIDETADDATFGGRAADYRQWDHLCHGKLVSQYVQDVVATPSAWALLMQNPDPGTAAGQRYLDAFHTVTQYSRLPAATGTVRYMDRGIIRSVQHTSAGVVIALDRVWRTRHGDVNNNPATYTYTVPRTLWDAAGVTTGGHVYLTTNGTSVISLVDDSPRN